MKFYKKTESTAVKQVLHVGEESENNKNEERKQTQILINA